MPYDAVKAAEYASQHYDHDHPYGNKHCAHYVATALANGGGFPMLHVFGKGYAKDFGPSLISVGFHALVPNLPPEAGDVVVMNGTSQSEAGHMAIYNGGKWVSDFIQEGIYPGPSYRKERPSYVIYRYRP